MQLYPWFHTPSIVTQYSSITIFFFTPDSTHQTLTPSRFLNTLSLLILFPYLLIAHGYFSSLYLISTSLRGHIQSQQSTIVLSHSSYSLCLILIFFWIQVFIHAHATASLTISSFIKCGFSSINNSNIYIAQSNQTIVLQDFNSSIYFHSQITIYFTE